MFRRGIISAVFAAFVIHLAGCSGGGSNQPATNNVSPPPNKDAEGKRVIQPTKKLD